MSGRKRQPGTILSISEIYDGHMLDMGDQTYFMMGEEPVHRVRIFGVVIERYDGITKSDREFITITLDDGSDTIRIKVWSRPIKENNEVVYNPIDLLKDAKVGDIMDVIGRVRKYEGEFFISPNSTSIADSIEWEIHRRSQAIQSYMQHHNLLDEPQPIFPEPVAKEESLDNEELVEDITDEILKAMVDDSEQNTVEILAEKINQPEDLVRSNIEQLHMAGKIIRPREGQYQNITD